MAEDLHHGPLRATVILRSSFGDSVIGRALATKFQVKLKQTLVPDVVIPHPQCWALKVVRERHTTKPAE